MKALYTILTVTALSITGCNSSEQKAQSNVESDRQQFLAAQATGEKSTLTQRQAFLGFVFYSKSEEVRAHLASLAKQGKVVIPNYAYGHRPSPELDYDFDYTFNIPNLDGAFTPVKFAWDEDRLKSISGEIRAYANDWVIPEIVKIFERKLGPSKSFFETDASKCHYWIKGGQEILLVFPLKGNPKFIYTALAPTQEYIEEKKEAEREKAIKDSTAASSTSQDL